MIRVEAVNIGERVVLRVGARQVPTGIGKTDVGRARVGVEGLERDVVADEVNHGGRDQAVYVYSREDYAWWEEELGRPLAPGTFGENLTFTSFGAEPLRIGDRFHVGDHVVLEATAPRIPCAVFATKMGEPRWVKRFARAERTGFYARVLAEGEVAVGDAVERRPAADEPELVELLRLWYAKDPSPDLLRALLASPLAERARADCERQLAQATAAAAR